jgi:hypothetical protein
MESGSHYLTPQIFQEELQRRLGSAGASGIGVTITQRKDASGTGWIFVEEVSSGSPAQHVVSRRIPCPSQASV